MKHIIILGGRPGIKPEVLLDLLEKSASSDGDGHWVTVKNEGPLHGRHLFISGDGRVLKGHGIPAHVIDHLNGEGKHHLKGAEPHKPKEPHEMSMQQYRDLPESAGKHHENLRVSWLTSMREAVEKHGKGAIPKAVYEAEPWLEPFIDNGFKRPRPQKEKIAGEGFPFAKEQTEKNSKFLDYGNGLFHQLSQDHTIREFRKKLHTDGYDAAIKFAQTHGHVGRGISDKELEKIRSLADEHKATGEGLSAAERAKPRGPKLYHASHDKDVKFGAIDKIDNYNRMGSWFTSDPAMAKEMYGPHVHEAHVDMKNPLVVNAKHPEDFFDTFYSPTLAKKYLTKAEIERWSEKDQNKLLNNGEYIAALKKNLVKSGYDGITFKNSTIDRKEDGSEGRHDVHIAFHPEKQVNNHKAPDTLEKSFREDYAGRTITPLKKGNHALVVPRKVAPVSIEKTEPEAISAQHLKVYHVTPAENAPSIKQLGLLPRYGKPTQQENPAYNAVYFHTDPKQAAAFNVGGAKALITAHIPMNKETVRRLRPDEDTFHKSAGEAIKAKSSIAYCGHVLPEWIQ